MWAGLGINYNSSGPGTYRPQDFIFLKKLGFTKIRLQIVDYTNTGLIGLWRTIVQGALAQGFYVIYGLTSNPTTLTSATWSSFASAVQTEAAWAQSQNTARLEFQIGNEEELHHDGSLTDAQVRANLRANAAVVKGIYTAGLVSYASSVSVRSHITDWISEGIGSMDRIGFNIYDTRPNFAINAALIRSGFGDSAYIAEWEGDGGFEAYRNELVWASEHRARLDILRNSGITEAYHYNFLTQPAAGVQYGIKLNTGEYRLAFAAMLERRPWYWAGQSSLPRSAITRPSIGPRITINRQVI